MTDNPQLQLHQHFMREALRIAYEAADKGEVPVGAIVVQNNEIIASAHNMVESLGDPTAHAEILAIRKACEIVQSKYLLKCTLYVTLEPCPMCSGALVWSKLSRVVYATIDHTAGGCNSLFNICSNRRLNHRIEVLNGILEDECTALLTSWFSAKRNRDQEL
ncbi:MAG: tRNA(adenine34) deaminase TadA [Bacteroidetes bacterium HLUCCA01]|nr:MAG: tRNA(adenine34) deaminase TadA [Bacteroidetes bacterium HLUCCA01]